ncbi:hypothetical protein L7F22_052629 [Adiantum nelumboides]|nr:hypothetical protein [Adiantum nelumboides]
MSIEEAIDDAAKRLAIESRSLLGLPQDEDGCKSGKWLRVLRIPPTALQFSQHLSRHIPLLIEGCMQDRSCFQRWKDSNYLINTMGSRKVQIALTPNGRADDIHNHNGKDVFALPAEEQMTFRDLFKTFDKDNQSTTIAYLQSQNSNLTAPVEDGRGDLSILLKDLLNGASDDNLSSRMKSSTYQWANEALDCQPEAINLWIGTEKSRTSMHRDHYENLFSVIRGTKIFTVYPPCEAHFLCEDEAFDVFQWSIKQDESWTLEPSSTPPTPWIPIDPTQSSSSERNIRYPLFSKALPPLTIEVKEGQTLYLPAGWFHHVSQKGDREGVCICVNWWYDSQIAFGDRWALETFVKEVGQISRGKDPTQS